MANSTNSVIGILISDQGNATVPGSGQVLLARDLDGDGLAASAGEITTFFDGNNASGLVSPTENVFTVYQANDRSVFIGDGDTDTIYLLKDRNGDGDANDAKEATAWFTPANANGFSTVTPNGIAQGKDGAIYITNAGTASAPPDMIYRTVDLNGDGDANDAGEATVWADLQTVIPTSVPFDITFVGNVVYVSDLAGAAEDVIHRLEDKNNDGVVTSDEITTFAFESLSAGAPIDIAIDNQDGSILALTWTASSGRPHKLFRLTDVNGDGTIDGATESVEVWNSSYLPAGFSQLAGFSVSASSNGQVALAVNGTGPQTKNIYLLNDFDGDGLYTSEGETTVFASNSYLGDSLYRPRGVEFYNDDQDKSIIRGTAGNNKLNGTTEGETLLGLAGNDTIAGASGNDTAWGGSGNDKLDGGVGDDLLRGGAGSDSVYGAAGNDDVRGGEGNDQLFGGAGIDTFAFFETDGADSHDRIADFADGTDKIRLDGLEIASIAAVKGGTLVTLDNGADILLANVKPAQLDTSDFIFTGDATGGFFV